MSSISGSPPSTRCDTSSVISIGSGSVSSPGDPFVDDDQTLSMGQSQGARAPPDADVAQVRALVASLFCAQFLTVFENGEVRCKCGTIVSAQTRERGFMEHFCSMGRLRPTDLATYRSNLTKLSRAGKPLPPFAAQYGVEAEPIAYGKFLEHELGVRLGWTAFFTQSPAMQLRIACDCVQKYKAYYGRRAQPPSHYRKYATAMESPHLVRQASEAVALHSVRTRASLADDDTPAAASAATPAGAPAGRAVELAQSAAQNLRLATARTIMSLCLPYTSVCNSPMLGLFSAVSGNLSFGVASMTQARDGVVVSVDEEIQALVRRSRLISIGFDKGDVHGRPVLLVDGLLIDGDGNMRLVVLYLATLTRTFLSGDEMAFTMADALKNIDVRIIEKSVGIVCDSEQVNNRFAVYCRTINRRIADNRCFAHMAAFVAGPHHTSPLVYNSMEKVNSLLCALMQHQRARIIYDAVLQCSVPIGGWKRGGRQDDGRIDRRLALLASKHGATPPSWTASVRWFSVVDNLLYFFANIVFAKVSMKAADVRAVRCEIANASPTSDAADTSALPPDGDPLEDKFVGSFLRVFSTILTCSKWAPSLSAEFSDFVNYGMRVRAAPPSKQGKQGKPGNDKASESDFKQLTMEEMLLHIAAGLDSMYSLMLLCAEFEQDGVLSMTASVAWRSVIDGAKAQFNAAFTKGPDFDDWYPLSTLLAAKLPKISGQNIVEMRDAAIRAAAGSTLTYLASAEFRDKHLSNLTFFDACHALLPSRIHEFVKVNLEKMHRQRANDVVQRRGMETRVSTTSQSASHALHEEDKSVDEVEERLKDAKQIGRLLKEVLKEVTDLVPSLAHASEANKMSDREFERSIGEEALRVHEQFATGKAEFMPSKTSDVDDNDPRHNALLFYKMAVGPQSLLYAHTEVAYAMRVHSATVERLLGMLNSVISQEQGRMLDSTMRTVLQLRLNGEHLHADNRAKSRAGGRALAPRPVVLELRGATVRDIVHEFGKLHVPK